MKNNKKTYELVLLAMFIAIEFVLLLTPLGYVKTGLISGTTLHIPVILAAIFLGYKGGIVLGLLMGITSIINNTLTPTITSFLFTPFYSIGTINGNFASAFNALFPRMMIGIVSAFVFILLKDNKYLSKAKYILPALFGSLTNTLLVCINIFVFFKDSFAAVRNVNPDAVVGLLVTLFTTNGISEAIIAVIICAVSGPILEKINKGGSL